MKKNKKILVSECVISYIKWTQKLGERLEWHSTDDLIRKYNNYLIRKSKQK